MPTRLAAANHHKPPPKRRKYAGFGTMGIPAIREGSGYGYGTVPGARWAIDTEGGHVVVSVSLIRNGYEYGRRSRGRFRIPPAIVAICRCL